MCVCVVCDKATRRSKKKSESRKMISNPLVCFCANESVLECDVARLSLVHVATAFVDQHHSHTFFFE
jgi:hypothetical protein